MSEALRPQLEQIALGKLYEAVKDRFVRDGRAAVAQPFGWREPAKQRQTIERIVWVPGDDTSGDLGKVGAPKYPGGNPRALATIGELFTCYVSSHDPTDPTNEFKQWRASRLLFDEWLRAVRLSANGLYEIVRSTWVIDKTQHRYGAAIRVLGAIQSTIPDYTLSAAPVNTKAAVTVVELDRSESFQAPP
jgi:hypothetical protein